MAKYEIKFENNKVNKKLTFNGDVYEYNMRPSRFGFEGDNKCFESQYKDNNPAAREDVIRILDTLDFEDDEQETTAIINALSNIEEALNI